MMNSSQPQGRACIYVPREIAPPGVIIPISAYLTHGRIFEQWRSFVQLPAAYSMVCMYVDQIRQQWVMVVASDRLPLPMPEQTVPALSVAFQRTSNGVRVVSSIRNLVDNNRQQEKEDISCQM